MPPRPWPPTAVRPASAAPPVDAGAGSGRRDLGAWVRPVAFPLVAVVIGVAAASATRLVEGWADGRVWALDIGLVAIAVLVGVRGVARGVTSVGEEWRRGAPASVVAARVGAVALITVALGAAGVRGGVDWRDLDVPAAWDRLELDLPAAAPLRDRSDGDDDVPVVVEEVGLCYSGRDVDDGAEVPCTDPHRLEVLDTVELTGPAGFPDKDDLSEQARRHCDDVETLELVDGMALGTDVPDRDEWTSGERTAACVVRIAGEPATVSVAKP